MIKNRLARTFFAVGLLTSVSFALFADVPKNPSSPVKSSEGLAGRKDVSYDVKIRYIDSMQVMQGTKKGAEVATRIDETRKTWSEEINQKGKQIEREGAEYSSKMSTMSEAAREKEEKRLAKAQRDYKTLIEEREQDFKGLMAKATEELFKEVEEIVTAMAKQENLDVVVDKVTGRVLYTSSQADYTNKVIVAMDKKYSSSTVVAENTKPASQSKVS